MREKDIVDFDKMQVTEDGEDHIDENGEVVGCHICYIHEKAYEKLHEDQRISVPVPHCPKCGKRLEQRYAWTDENYSAIVSEVNFHVEDGNIGYYTLFECPECKNKYGNEMIYALIPIPVSWNANHDIYCTGGRKYLIEKEHAELAKLLKEKIMPNIKQFVERKLDPKDGIDKNLSIDFNLNIWTDYAIEEAVAEWLYKNGWKK